MHALVESSNFHNGYYMITFPTSANLILRSKCILREITCLSRKNCSLLISWLPYSMSLKLPRNYLVRLLYFQLSLLPVHQAKAAGIGHNLIPCKGFMLQESLLIFVKSIVVRISNEVIGGKEKAPLFISNISPFIATIK